MDLEYFWNFKESSESDCRCQLIAQAVFKDYLFMPLARRLLKIVSMKQHI